MSNTTIDTLKEENYSFLVKAALQEDLLEIGDTTSLATIPAELEAKAVLITREDCYCAGLPVAEASFLEVDSSLKFTALVKDGDFCPAGTELASITGKAQSLLTAERTALNFIQRLTGIATTSNRYVQATGETGTKILDTRKTTPGYRILEKYAVNMGGAVNHRIGLYDRIMIKDNHRELASLEGEGGIIRSVEACRQKFPTLEVEVEADRLDEVAEALKSGAEYILLDNMSNEEISQAVSMRNEVSSKALLEISGGVTLERIPELSKLGADFISVGALTHSVKSTDISLDIKL